MLKKYSRIIIFALCVVLTLAYIFSNSLKSQEKSNDTSTKITEQIKPIIDPKNKIPTKELNHKLRKTAHCIEFGVLGIFLALLFDSIKKCFDKTDIFAPLMFALSAAVTDEYIQTFNDRGSQVEDILIDFSGAIFGLFLVFIFAMVLHKRSKT
ncbi:MAG: VanZ family protein [Clostridia bacterium]|nr:VanZ family protein [Clostridia bacterium]